VAKERYQSLTLGDDVNLDFYSYQNNSLINVSEIQKIEVYFLDPNNITSSNIDGRSIKKIIPSTDITQINTGHYRAVLTIDDNLYEIGDFIDVWFVRYNTFDSDFFPVINQFKVFSDLRETWDRPFVYDVDFSFDPKKIVSGNKKYIRIGFFPNIQIEKDIIDRFYFNLKTTGNLFIRIEQIEGCGFDPDLPAFNVKTDPEWDQVDIRGDNEAYYLIDSTDNGDYVLGIYAVQFKILIDGQEIISPKFYLQIFD
jgi:hypothetical protein